MTNFLSTMLFLYLNDNVNVSQDDITIKERSL